MKKQLSFILCGLMLTSLLGSCSQQPEDTGTPGSDGSVTIPTESDTAVTTARPETESSQETEPDTSPDTTTDTTSETETAAETLPLLPITAKNPSDETAPPELGTADMVNAAVDIIMRYDGIGSAYDFIAAYPSAYQQIIDLGEDALPALQSILDESTDADRQNIARYAMNEIDPSRSERTFTSPDGRYKLSLCDVDNVNSAIQWYNGYHLDDAKTGEVLYKGSIATTIVDVEWSDDGRYAVITAGDERYHSEPVFLNLETMSEIYIPLKVITDAIDEALPEKGYTDFTIAESVYSSHCKITEWLGADTVKIELNKTLGAAGSMGLVSTAFTLDLTDGSYSELEFEVQLEAKDESPSSMNPSHETAPKGLTMEETIRADLAILARVNWGGCNADNCIDTYPDAYAQIISFGDDALPLLDAISAGNAEDFAAEADDVRQFQYMARAIRYRLHPEVYDRFYDSPDGAYRVRLTNAESFDDTSADSFRAIEALDAASGDLLASFKVWQLKDESVVFRNEKFAVIYESYGFNNISVYGIDGSSVSLPKPYKLIKAVEERLAENGITAFTLDNKQCNTKVSFSGFVDLEHVKVDFTIYINPSKTYSEIVGSYVYSLKDENFSELAFTAQKTDPADTEAAG